MDGNRRVVIVGGVAAGMSAATRLRRLDERAEIMVLERGEYVSFANCGLPYYVGGVIADRASLLVQTPEVLRRRFALDVRVGHEAVRIDSGARRILVREVASGAESWEDYDALVLAAGARAVSGFAGGGVPVRGLHTIDDVDAVAGLLDRAPEQAVVVVGGGFIGMEAAENLRRRGLPVTLVHRGAHPLSALDPEMAWRVREELLAHDVALRLRRQVVRLEPGAVVLDDGERVPAGFVIDARGVRPDTALASSAGVRLGPTGGIAVDGLQRTSVAGIWAVGDGVEKTDAIDERPTLITMAGLANRHGRAAADDIAGAGRPGRAGLGTAVIGVFDLTVAITGWSERRLRAAGIPHRVIHTHPFSHATYYPGARQMAMKLLVHAGDDRILGAQIVGGDGVDKRIDVIATAMSAGLTASELGDLELAYAPQYGSAKDPINLLGNVAENLADGCDRGIQWHELDDALAAGAVLVDVRSEAEFAAGAIPGALNLPLERLRDGLDALPPGPLVVHCQVGQRGHTAARMLTQHGRDVRNLDGGYLTWRAGRAVCLDTPWGIVAAMDRKGS
ncbi:FAD-dependent oxidoreductase [Pseudolysinimonas sp.]|uniref:FAD-dependent oxidoreductase n=1 Tax=Pseudolysinimonas sp. TaxID=2680009 RepID=UPI003F7DCE8C